MHLIPSQKQTQRGIAAHPPRVLSVALVHCFTFGFMAYLCIALLHEIDVLNAFFLPFQAIFVVSFVSFVGMLTEVIQSHTATRTADLNDLAADFVGAVVFVLLCYGVIKRKQTLRQRNWQ